MPWLLPQPRHVRQDGRMRHVKHAAAVLILLAAAAPARDLKLLAEGEPDATELSALVADVTRGCKGDQEKMVALWSYITSRPFYHWAQALEEPEAAGEMGVVYDPIAVFNVHGTLICYQVADVLANLAEAAGIRSRTLGLPGHKTMEACYDGQWHCFDATYDCAAYFVGDDGRSILSLEQVCKDAGRYIRQSAHPSRPFFQFDSLGGKFWPWESKQYVIANWYKPEVPAKADIFAPYIVRGHRVLLNLRRGERLIRRFDNEGKWHCPPHLYQAWQGDKTQKWLDAGPHDPRRPENRYANGLLVYEPDWHVEANFLDGLDSGSGYVLKDGSVRPADPAKPAELVFRVETPYLIAGKPGKLDVADDSTEGAVFDATVNVQEGASFALAASTDNGLSWKDFPLIAKPGGGQVRADLTPYVEGRYGYLVRVRLSGQAEMAKLNLRTSLFYTPVSLPAVKPGKNRFHFKLDEGLGMLNVRPDLADQAGYKRFFRQIEALKYSPKFVQHLSPVRGEGFAVMELAGQAGAKIEQVTVSASFGAAPRGAKDESAEILVAASPDGPWISAFKSDFSARNDKWRWDAACQARLEPSAERAYVKFVLRQRNWMSLNRATVYATYRRAEAKLPPGSVRIRHVWDENGQERSHEARPALPSASYDFEAGPAVKNTAVIMEVENDSP